ncbi:uncharacterized protein B0P05DRAFT_562021 [Gilbertella persicaria]|uniref:uncharacterized protein n=1 Tax=Gilbertella persicaria TaxID=101096 RepID=UPI00221EA176|nr:uncharacterized protein B0P05DRAFT_562021 [Gilbertella persicaria]KAI8052582.1 hypothetical protein B0P05DRAFT_562021 [Gilbertella persicaria]
MSEQPLSIEERLFRLAAKDTSELPEFPDDKSDLPSDFEYDPEEYEDQEVEIVEEISEEELLKYLEQKENVFQAESTEYQQGANCLTAQLSPKKQGEIPGNEAQDEQSDTVL